MARKEAVSWTQRLGGNRALVLGVVLVILVLFTVESYVFPAFGFGNRAEQEYVRFTIGGRAVSLSGAKYQSGITDWQFFQRGIGAVTGVMRGTSEEYLEDLMLAERAREAGIVVPDGAVREFVLNFPTFKNARGDFESGTFDASLASHFGRLTPRAFEDQVRAHLLVDHLRNLYARSMLQVSDDEAYRRWKSDSPKVAVAYTWFPVAPVRAAIGPGDLKAGELEEFWKNSIVQLRHRTPRKFAFEAASVHVASVVTKAYEAAREELKSDPTLAFKDNEGFDYYARNKGLGFDLAEQSEAVVKELRAENESRVREEDAKVAKDAPPPSETEPKDPNAPAPGPIPDLYDVPPDTLPPLELYRRYWQARIEKELWLKKRMARLLADARDGKGSLKDLAAAASRDGLEVRFHLQETPIDQYRVEELPGIGGPNCPLRYTVNQKKSEDEGKVHGDVIEATAEVTNLTQRGWIVFRTTAVQMEAVPPLDAVREKVLEECLDQRARERTMADAEAFRKFAEDSRKGLAAAAAEKTIPSSTAEPFNAYSWRPPIVPPKPGEELPPASERWKDPARRLSLVMSRYQSFRDTPQDSYASVVDDADGTGACYVVQVTGRTDATFEEMTLAQKNRARQTLVGERFRDFDRELSFAALKERYGLLVDGKSPSARPEGAE